MFHLARLLPFAVAALVVALHAQEPPQLPTEPANPPHNDVWIWVEQPVGVISAPSVTIKFWAFRCGGTIKKVQPSTLRTGKLETYVSNLPRPDVQTAMAAKCGSIPLNTGYSVTMDLTQLPRGPEIGYALDVEVTDDLGRKTMLRQTRGAFTIR